MAAFTVWKPTTINVIANVPNAAAAKIHQEMVVRYSKFCNQLCIQYQAMGEAINREIQTSNTKSADNSCQTFSTDAPSIFRMPISLVLCSAINEAMPNSPRQLIKMASTVKEKASLPMRSSTA